MIGAGMDEARINESLDEHSAHARRIQQIRQLAGQMRQPVAVPLVAVTDSERLGGQLADVWGVSPLVTATTARLPACVEMAAHWFFARRCARPSDPVIVASCSDASAEKLDTLQTLHP